jgi:tryptophan synthase beta chain
VDEAKKAKEEAKEKVILFNWSGHGLIDLAAYDKYLSGQLENISLDEEAIMESQKVLEEFPKPALLKSR